MTDAADSSGDKLIREPADQLIQDADIQGIGTRVAERLETAGIASVGQLAEADIDHVVDALAEAFPRWKADTLQHKAEAVQREAQKLAPPAGPRVEQSEPDEQEPDQEIRAAEAPTNEQENKEASTQGQRAARTPRRTRQGHVFLVTLWADADGRPVKSEFRYRSPDVLTEEERSEDIVGWSPLAFSRFVDRAAGLSEGRDLSEERVDSTDLVEWSHHRVQGPLVRGGEEARPVEAAVPTDQLDTEEGVPIRWRASARLVPLGGGSPIALGKCAGSVQRGETIEIALEAFSTPRSLYRTWFDLAITPPPSRGVPIAALGRASAADR